MVWTPQGSLAPPAVPAPTARAAAASAVSVFTEDWAGGPEGSVAPEAADFVRGSRALRLISNGAGGYGCFATLVRSAVDFTGRNVRLTLMTPDASRIERIHLLVGDAGFANYQTFTIQAAAQSSNFIRSGEWTTITVPWSVINAGDVTGNPPRGAITNFRVRVVDRGAGPATVYFGAIESVQADPAYPNGVVSITFDDGRASTWSQARPLFDARGMAASLFLIADRIGTPGYMTLAQARSLQDNSSWDVGGHAATLAAHDAAQGLLTGPLADAEREVAAVRRWLARNGFDGRGFAYPQGYVNRALADAVGRHFSYGRSIIGASRETVLPADPTMLRSSSGVSSFAGGLAPTELTAAGGELDKVKGSPGWLILTMHDIVSGAASSALECSATDLASILDACTAKGIPVHTVSRVLDTMGARQGATYPTDASIALPGSAARWARVDVPNDGSSTAGWPDRLAFYFDGTRAGYFNEYGELRARPARSNTVGFRAMAHGQGAAGQDYFQVAETSSSDPALAVSKQQITARLPIASTQSVTAPNIGTPVRALPVGASVPGDFPDPVIIVRY